LRKADHFALCVLWPVGDRVELRINMTDEVVVSQGCLAAGQAEDLSHAWLAALLARGWREAAASEAEA